MQKRMRNKHKAKTGHKEIKGLSDYICFIATI